jgi:glycosyltransferase involved in cell wall biosynthesis
MGPQDGVDHFVRAAAAVLAERPRSATFVAIGGGNQLNALRTLSTELGLATSDLLFTGRVPDSLVRTYLSTADVAVSPDPANQFNEYCTMNKTLEYMACGIPIVAFDLAETRVSAGDAAVYATPNRTDELARHILELFDDPERRAEMGRIGRERMAGPLAWVASERQLRAAYAAAVAFRAGSRRQRTRNAAVD